MSENDEEGFPVYINSKNGQSEEYTVAIGEDRAAITSDGANGAFYGLQTLKQLLMENNGIVECTTINDAPDMKYRGFYHDISRGKIPTLETLKELVDTMASYKLNSLQLYVEHSFEFKEYEPCREKLGCLTKEEIRELDRYCRSKFIELIPSVSTFGHLYHLLTLDKYRRLSELPDYEPKVHYWKERMLHHTINPELDESFELIKSLIDQYLEVTTSDKFNICCDETFDLGNGVNLGKDKTKLYVGFVKKIADYLISKGKTVMMWGDILLQHPEYIGELPENIIFLNWEYSVNPSEEPFEKLHKLGKKQILCPGTSSWYGFAEDVAVEESNIATLAEYAYKFGAEGLLVTNWGDLGNLASITTSSYGLTIGAAVSWNKETAVDANFRKDASKRIYGNMEFLDVLTEVFKEIKVMSTDKMVTKSAEYVQFGCIPKPTFEEYQTAAKHLKDILHRAKALSYSCETVKREALNALGGFLIIAVTCAKIDGFTVECGFDTDEWMEEFSKLWLEKNKPSELSEVRNIIASSLETKN